MTRLCTAWTIAAANGMVAALALGAGDHYFACGFMGGVAGVSFVGAIRATGARRRAERL